MVISRQLWCKIKWKRSSSLICSRICPKYSHAKTTCSQSWLRSGWAASCLGENLHWSRAPWDQCCLCFFVVQNMLWGLWATEPALGFVGRRTCSGVCGPHNMLWGLWATEHALGFMGRRTCSGVYGPQNMLWGLWAAEHALGFMGHRTCSGVYGPQNMLWGLWAAEHALGFMGRRTCSGVYGPQNLLWGLWAHLTWAFICCILQKVSFYVVRF